MAKYKTRGKTSVQTENATLLREFVKATLRRALSGGRKKRNRAVKTLAALSIARALASD